MTTTERPPGVGVNRQWVSELAGFYSARLDEREQLARAAICQGDGSWRVEHYGCDDECPRPCPKEVAPGQYPTREQCHAEHCRCHQVAGDDIWIYAEGGHDEDQAEHIAANDPRWALADVAAGRKLLAAYQVSVRRVGEGMSRTLRNLVCDRAETYGHPGYHLATCELTVRVNRTQVGSRVEEGAPKSEDSVETIALDSASVAVLTDWQLRQREERELWGGQWTDTGHVFTREDGLPYQPNYLTATFQRLACAAGVPPVRLHDLRHLTAVLLHRAGADMKDIQFVLRHASVTITMNLYTSVLAEQDREIAEKASGLIPRSLARPRPRD